MQHQHRTTKDTRGDGEKVAAIRAALPAVQAAVYLNTGTCGPLPRRSFEAFLAQATVELEHGRIRPAHYVQLQQEKHRVRAALATLLGCASEEIALTHNATEGLNIALMGLNWEPGDEVVTAKTEHPGGLNPLALLKQRYGVRIRQTEIGRQDRHPGEELARALNARTKAVLLSHVSWRSGMVLPMQELTALAHRVGALVICDGAQAGGMIPSNVAALGVDAYALSGQKWLCGPEGTGALFLRKDLFGRVWQTYIGDEGAHLGEDGSFVPMEGAPRYEAATLNPASVKALGASLQWITEEVGWEWVYERIATLGRYCYERLEQVEGVTMHSPRIALAGLVHFSLAGLAAEDLTRKLYEQGIIVRAIPGTSLIRVSTGFYNTEQEIEHLIETIKAVRMSKPS
jgi:L-cysteine/cystine lyase